MKTYFCISDVHGFYDEMLWSLSAAGFNQNDPEHILIVCGDIFDRGERPLQVYEYFKSLPVDRRVMIRGNHEALLNDLYNRGYPEWYDKSNGTYDTLAYLAGAPSYEDYQANCLYELNKLGLLNSYSREFLAKRDELAACRHDTLFHCAKTEEVLNWIHSDEWRDFYELGGYIFVHSFIPTKNQGLSEDIKFSYPPEYRKDWRNATSVEWEVATWGNPWAQYQNGLFDEEARNGKILVCGHWHTADFWNNLTKCKRRLNPRKENPLFKTDECPNIIGLDACTAATHKVNVLVLTEDDLGRHS